MARSPFVKALFASAAVAQQVFEPTDGPTARPQCTSQESHEPEYSFTPFSYTQTTTVRYATSVPSPTTTTTYAAPPESLSSLVSSLSYTTWGNWDPEAAETPSDSDDPYGRAAWTALWRDANISSFTAVGLYSTTVEPTPLPSSELVLPPRDYFGPSDCYDFPAGFAFGVSSSASQIEGAAATDGKSPSLMDILPWSGNNSFVTNEHYYLYKQDIERVAAMGVKHFSFSIPWTRILPFARPGTPVNQQAIDHYNDVINFVVEKGMNPSVTLIHFDSPSQFVNATRDPDAPRLIGYQDGGYQHEDFVESFVNYAKIVMAHYADRVETWYTFNEPLLYSATGQSIYNVLQAHAQASHFYKDEIKGKGKVSIKFNNNFGVPRDPESEADLYATEHFNSFQLGPFCNPIFLGQDYPESYKQTVPDFIPLTEEDLTYMNGTADYLGIDPYTATVIAPPTPGDADSVVACAQDINHPLQPYCVNQTTADVYGWNIGYRSQSYVYITPTYLRSYLNYLYNTWRIPVALTEFGFPVFGEIDKALPDQLFDTPRSLYYLSFMSEVLKSIWEDGVEVVGAYAWSFADNWEFGSYAPQFGIQFVNRTTQERKFKKSFFDLVDFMKARGVE